MRIGIYDHRKAIVAGTLMAVAVLLTGHLIPGLGTSKSLSIASVPLDCEQKPVAQTKDATPDPTLHFEQLDLAENQLYRGTGRNIFQFEEISHTRQIPTPPKPFPPDAVADRVVQPIALRFFGFALMVNQNRKAFLGRGDAIFVANEGEIVDRRYRVVRIDLDSVQVEDLIEKSIHTLPLPG